MKFNILNRLLAPLLVAASITSPAYAAIAIKSSLGTDLAATTAGIWTGGSGTNGSPTSADVATWTSSSLGPNLTLDSDVVWGGMNIGGATAAIAITGGGKITTGNISLAGTQTLSISNPIELTGNSVYSIADVNGSSTTDATLSNDISGAFGITKSGNGTLTLSASSSYTGATTVNAGTLNITESANLTSSITINSGATLTGIGTTSGNITFNAGSNIITAGSLPVRAGNVVVNATTNIFVTATPTGTSASCPVIEHLGSLTGLANFTPATHYRAGSISDADGTVSLTYTGEAKTWGDAAGTWEIGTASQWTGGSDTAFYWGDSVAFGAIAADRTVTLNGKLAPTSIAVSNAANTYTFSGSGGITGPCSLSKSGAGTLTLATPNTHTGTTTVSGGQLNVTGSGTLGAGALTMSGVSLDLGGSSQTVGPVSVTAASTIQNGSLTGTSYAVSNGTGTAATISANLLANGSAGLTKSGNGSLELSGANTYTGPTTLSNTCNLSLTGGDNRLATTGTVNFTGAHTLNLNSTQQTLDSLTVNTSSNCLVTGAGGKLTLTGPNFQLGSTTAGQARTLNMGGATPLSSFAYENPAGTFSAGSIFSGPTVASTSLTLALTNVITASAINVGNFLGPANTLNKGTAVNLGQTTTLKADTITIGAGDRVTGALQFASSSALTSPSLTIRGTDGNSRATMVVGSQAGTTVSTTPLAGTVNLVQFITGTSILDAKLGTLTIGQNVRTTSAGASTSNCNGLFRMGAGTVDATTILLGQDTDGFDSTNAENSVTNATFTTDTVTAGFATVKVNTLTLGDKRSSSSKMTLNSIFNLSNGGVLHAGTIAAGAGNAATVTRTINWNDGTIKNYDTATDLTLGGGINVNLAATGTHTFDIETSRTASVSAVLADVTATPGGTLVKSGSGALILSGVSTYTGTTTVNGGTLLANNTSGSATGTGIVTVKAAATLGGSGAVGGSVILESGGTLAPGASIESLATGPLTLATGSTLAAEIRSSGTPALDVVNVTGDLTLGGALNITDIAAAPAILTPGTKLTLITYSGALAGTFSGKAEGSTFAVAGNTFKIRYADSNAVTLEAVAATGGTGYAGWAALAGVGAADADDDNDGLDNGAEYVLGTNPKSGTAGGVGAKVSGGNMTFTFNRSDASETPDTAVSIEVGTTLASWPSVFNVGADTASSSPGVTVTENPAAPGADPGSDLITVTVPMNGNSKMFGRLHVAIAP